MKLSAVRADVRRERPTINMYCGEDDAMDGSDGGKEQGSCQASVPEPFCFSSKYTGYYEDIVPGKNRLVVKCQLVRAKDKCLWAHDSAYKTLEPVPYWPDTGQAHTTCKALLVSFAAVVTASRPTSAFSSEGEERTGMTSGPSWENIAWEQKQNIVDEEIWHT
jgi:hypothetical protein